MNNIYIKFQDSSFPGEIRLPRSLFFKAKDATQLVGRSFLPLGFKLSEASKRAISEAKRGQRHKEETKEKISKSLIIYFRRRNPLSEEIINTYCRIDDDDMCLWMTEVQEELDECTDILTQKSMRNTRRIELTCGEYIEYFSHELTPEVIALFKEKCRLEGLDPDEAFDKLDLDEDGR